MINRFNAPHRSQYLPDTQFSVILNVVPTAGLEYHNFSLCVCDAQVRSAERILASLLNETETVAPLRSSCASAMSAHSEMLVHFFCPSN